MPIQVSEHFLFIFLRKSRNPKSIMFSPLSADCEGDEMLLLHFYSSQKVLRDCGDDLTDYIKWIKTSATVMIY